MIKQQSGTPLQFPLMMLNGIPVPDCSDIISMKVRPDNARHCQSHLDKARNPWTGHLKGLVNQRGGLMQPQHQSQQHTL